MPQLPEIPRVERTDVGMADALGFIQAGIVAAHALGTLKLETFKHYLELYGYCGEVVVGDPDVDEVNFNRRLQNRPDEIATAKIVQVRPSMVNGRYGASSGNDAMVYRPEDRSVMGGYVPMFKIDQELILPGNELQLLEEVYHNLSPGRRKIVLGQSVVVGNSNQSLGLHAAESIEWTQSYVSPTFVGFYLWGRNAVNMLQRKQFRGMSCDRSELEGLIRMYETTNYGHQQEYQYGFWDKTIKFNGGIQNVAAPIRDRVSSVTISGVTYERGSSGFDPALSKRDHLVLSDSDLRILMIREAVSIIRGEKPFVDNSKELFRTLGQLALPIAWNNLALMEVQ